MKTISILGWRHDHMKYELENIEQLGHLIRTHRKRAGLNQTDLAEMAGVGKTLIFDLEKGHKKVSLEKLMAILKVLNIKLYLLPPSSGS